MKFLTKGKKRLIVFKFLINILTCGNSIVILPDARSHVGGSSVNRGDCKTYATGPVDSPSFSLNLTTVTDFHAPCRGIEFGTSAMTLTAITTRDRFFNYGKRKNIRKCVEGNVKY